MTEGGAISVAGAPARHGRTLQILVRGVIGTLLLFAVLEWISTLGIVPAEYLPHATTVARRIPALLADPEFQVNLAATVFAWCVSLAIVVVVAVPLGIVLGSSDWTFKFTAPLINLMRPIPSVCLLPLMLVLLGTGLSMKLVLVSYATVWPVLFNTIYGIHNVDPVTVETARCFGLGRLAIIRRISIPSAAPFIFTGIRISASIGLVVIVSSELIASSHYGIGAFIMSKSSGAGTMDIILAAAAVAGLLGLVSNIAFVALDRRKFAWRYASGVAA